MIADSDTQSIQFAKKIERRNQGIFSKSSVCCSEWQSAKINVHTATNHGHNDASDDMYYAMGGTGPYSSTDILYYKQTSDTN